MKKHLAHELEARLLKLRSDYEEGEDIMTNGVGETSQFFDYSKLLGLHLVANTNFIDMLSLHAICISRGGSNLFRPLCSKSNFNSYSYSDDFEQPKVWMKQIRIPLEDTCQKTVPVEADASCLFNWSHALLCPDSSPYNANLVLFHPKRASSGQDDLIALELQSIYEFCGFGTLFSRSCESFKVNLNSWDETTRNLGIAFHEWLKLPRDAELDYVILIVWPNNGWSHSRSALAACATSIATSCVVHIVPEDLVLTHRTKKSRLISLATGIYSLISRGKGIVTIADIVSYLISYISFTNLKNKGGEERIHLAIALSSDERWLTYSWCSGKGEHLHAGALATRELTDVTSRNEAIISCIEEIYEETKINRFAILTHNLAPGYFSFETLLVKQESEIGSNKLIWWSESENPSNWSCSSLLQQNDETLKKELDNLAFLSEISESPAKGALKGTLFGILEARSSSFKGPMHLKCAILLAHYLNGIVPGEYSNKRVKLLVNETPRSE